MSTALDTDLTVLVGELEQVPCELPQHGAHPIHSDGPASHYVRARCPLCNDDTGVIAACKGFIAAVLANLPGRCRHCSAEHLALDIVTVLGPVSQ